MTVEEMFAIKLVVSSLVSVMQTTPEGSRAIHHPIDSCRIRNSNMHLKVIQTGWERVGVLDSGLVVPTCPSKALLLFICINSLVMHFCVLFTLKVASLFCVEVQVQFYS